MTKENNINNIVDKFLEDGMANGIEIKEIVLSKDGFKKFLYSIPLHKSYFKKGKIVNEIKYISPFGRVNVKWKKKI